MHKDHSCLFFQFRLCCSRLGPKTPLENMDLMFGTFSPTEHDSRVSNGYVRTVGMYWPWLRPLLWHVPGFSLRLQSVTVTYCQLPTAAEVLQYRHHRHIVSILGVQGDTLQEGILKAQTRYTQNCRDFSTNWCENRCRYMKLLELRRRKLKCESKINVFFPVSCVVCEGS